MTLVQRIKKHEGFRGEQYLDHLGNPTIGYGILLPLAEKEAEMLLQYRLANAIMELQDNKPEIVRMPQAVQDALGEMAYQLGVPSLLKFVKMWKALKDEDYVLASKEALDSKWAVQTPNRAKDVARRLIP